jgi:hypothetical protein
MYACLNISPAENRFFPEDEVEKSFTCFNSGSVDIWPDIGVRRCADSYPDDAASLPSIGVEHGPFLERRSFFRHQPLSEPREFAERYHAGPFHHNVVCRQISIIPNGFRIAHER